MPGPAAPTDRTTSSWRWALVIASGLAIWLVPVPPQVEVQAWRLFAIFVATIVGIIVRPHPMSVVALVGMSVAVFTDTLTIGQALGGFANPVVWLVWAAFLVASAFIRTGLGLRIAYLFIRRIGRRTLGLAYGLVATDLVLAPAIPSNTARAGGVIFPILRSLGRSFDSAPEDGTARRIGAFLTFTAYQGTVVTSAMFLTAMVANPLAVELAAGLGVEISWGSWALAAVVPGLLSLAVVPWLIYRLFPPEIVETPGAAEMAAQRLGEMGALTRDEWALLAVFVLLLFLWVFGVELGVHSATAALGGVVALLLSGVLTWSQVLEQRDAWDTMIWFAVLVMMAGFLGEFGLTAWVSERIGAFVGGRGWVPAFLLLSLTYFYSHYFFASNTAHVSAMYAPFLGVAIAVGAPPLMAALTLAFFSNLFASLTHYGTAPAPIFYGSGYVELGTWWRLGALISVVNIGIWLGVGSLWWKVLGLW